MIDVFKDKLKVKVEVAGTKMQLDEELSALIYNFDNFEGLKEDQKIAAFKILHSIKLLSDSTKNNGSNSYDIQFEIRGIPGLHTLTIDGQFIILNGEAGTGKSYLTGFLISFIEKVFKIHLAGACPTWKAVSVFNSFAGIEAMTVAALTGNRPDTELEKIKPNGDNFSFTGKPLFNTAKLWIFDEISMIPKVITEMIKEGVTNNKCIAICIGDKEQLPPVGERESSQMFNLTKNISTLDIPARQALTNPNIVLARICRNEGIKDFEKELTTTSINLQGTSYFGKFYENKGYIVRPTKKTIQDVIKRVNTNEYLENPSSNNILCFTRAQVTTYNKAVRQVLFPNKNSSEVQVNEVLRCYRTIYVGESLNSVVKHSGIYKVVSTTNVFESPKGINVREVKLYDTYVKSLTNTPVWIVDSSSFGRMVEAFLKCYNIYVDKGKPYSAYKGDHTAYGVLKKIMNTHLLTTDIWYNPYTKDLSPIEQANYVLIFQKTFWSAFAGTIHTAQGSTYKNSYIDLNDILSCRDMFTRKALLYVALTRASDNNIIFNTNF